MENKTKESNSNRKLAIAWWNSLSENRKLTIQDLCATTICVVFFVGLMYLITIIIH